MTAGTVSGLITALLLTLFLIGWRWVWSSRRIPEFAAAAQLPLADGHWSPTTAQSISTPAQEPRA